MFDQAGMVREHVKWDYELRSGSQIESVLDRALAIAHSDPQGPVYLSLPREVLSQDSPHLAAHTTQHASTATTPNPADVAHVAQLMRQAKCPLIVTARSGRDTAAVGLLGEVVQPWAWPVVEFRTRHMCLPNTHPCHAGYETAPWLAHADLMRLNVGVFVLHAVQLAMWVSVPALLVQAGLQTPQHWPRSSRNRVSRATWSCA